MQEVPQRPFDIVWFSGSPEAAISSLVLLDPQERMSRGLKHNWRLWQNCPMPNVDGTIKVGEVATCIAINRLGSAQLSPGQTADGKIGLASKCDPLVQCADFIGATIKAETWQLPEIQKEAIQQRDVEQNAIAQMEKRKKEIASKFNHTIEDGYRRYFVTCARMVMKAGTQNPETMTIDQLKDVFLMASMQGVEFPQIKAWMAVFAPEEPTEAEDLEPYDRMSYLPYAHSGFTMLQDFSKKQQARTA